MKRKGRRRIPTRRELVRGCRRARSAMRRMLDELKGEISPRADVIARARRVDDGLRDLAGAV